MRRQVEIPDKCFHVTDKRWVKSILKEGLMRGKNRLARFDEEDEGIFVTSDYEVLLQIEGSFVGRELEILEIDMVGIKDRFQPDRAFDFVGVEDMFTESDIAEGLYDQFCWFILDTIDPDRIKIHNDLRE